MATQTDEAKFREQEEANTRSAQPARLASILIRELAPDGQLYPGLLSISGNVSGAHCAAVE